MGVRARRGPPAAVRAGLRFLAGAAWRGARWESLVWGASYVVSGAAPAAQIAFVARLLDALATAHGRWAAVAGPAVGLAVAALAGQAMYTVQPALRGIVEMRLRRALDGDLLAHLLGLDLATRERPDIEDLAGRVSGPGGTATDLLEACFGWLHHLTTMVSLAALLALVRWWLPLALIAGGVPLAMAAVGDTLAHRGLDLDQAADQRLLGHLAGVVARREAQPEVRVYGLADHLVARWQALFLRLGRQRTALVSRQAARDVPGMAVPYLLTLGGVLVLARTHGVPPGRVVALVPGLAQLVEAVGGASHITGALVDAAGRLGDLVRLRELRGVPAAPPSATAHEFGSIRLQRVTFSYPGRDRPAVAGVSLVVRPGERLALVGPNGAGKSTLVKCILGLYRPSSGRVLVGGAATPVFQEFLRPEFLAREAIGLDADLGRVRRAAAAGGAAGFVAALPRGYETPLGRGLYDDGADLSSGQWQRVAISRGMCPEPAVLVLDEPAAALDPRAEADLYARFAEVASGRTVVLVSHRLGAARLADRIAVLDGGRLVEVGGHEALVARGGLYARMWAAQAEWYA